MAVPLSPLNVAPAYATVQGRAWFLWLGVAYLAFVIYGSLVPLAFHARPLSEAWQAFRAIQFLDLLIASRADWVANILLFIPLAFIWCGVLWPTRRRAFHVAVLLAVWLACMGLSVAIEFIQLFFPPRSVTLNDIVAETLGASLGVTAWWLWGTRTQAWLVGWRHAHAPLDRWGRLLYVYLFVLFAYNLLPLDLTLSVAELFHKWQEGRVILIPFSYVFANPLEEIYGLFTDVLIWVPVAILWCVTRPATNRLRVWLTVVLLASLLEAMQLFVFTRVSDTTDIFSAALGTALGVWLSHRRAAQSAPSDAQRATDWHQTSALWWGLAFLWCGVLILIFWYPFNFQFDAQFLAGRWPNLFKVPFEAYYFGSEYRAATEVLHKVGFFMPLGAVLALAIRPIKSVTLRNAARWFGFVLIFLSALGIEIGQFFLPAKNADITDWLLASLGGLIGYAMARYLMRTSVLIPSRTAPVSKPHANQPALEVYGPRRVLRALALSGGFFVVIGWGLTHAPWMPYNVRELLDPVFPLLSVFLLTLALYWTIGFPVWMQQQLARGELFLLSFPFWVLVHGLVAWTLTRPAVPLESVYDIVGTPVLNWPWEWEMLGRFLALFSLWSVAATGGVIIATWKRMPSARIAIAGWVIGAGIWVPLGYYIVVVQAATDNLTELMAHDASVSAFVQLGVFLFGLMYGGARSAWLLLPREAHRGRALLALVIAVVLTYLALHAALEQTIVKYDQVFSAQQFLLSRDREHLAGPAELLIRYLLFYVCFATLIATIAYPLLRWAQTDRLPRLGKCFAERRVR